MAIDDLKKLYKEQVRPGVSSVEFESSGILGLDNIIGGGIPRGRLIEISGAESSGKTTLTLHLCKQVIDQGGTVLYIDLEKTIIKEQLLRAGIDPESPRFYYTQPNSGEAALGIFCDGCIEGEVNLAIIDSVPLLMPEKYVQEEDIGKAQMAGVSRLLSPQMNRITGICSQTGTTLIMINQIRDKLTGYGGYETPGGHALKHMFSVRLQLRKQKPSETEIESVIKVLKNKVGPAYDETKITITSSDQNAIDIFTDAADVLTELKIIRRKGAWYSLPPELAFEMGLTEELGKDVYNIGQGVVKAGGFLKSHPLIYQALYLKGLEAYKAKRQESFI